MIAMVLALGQSGSTSVNCSCGRVGAELGARRSSRASSHGRCAPRRRGRSACGDRRRNFRLPKKGGSHMVHLLESKVGGGREPASRHRRGTRAAVFNIYKGWL